MFTKRKWPSILLGVAILTIIAAVAVPNLWRSRWNANETETLSQMRKFVEAEYAFKARDSNRNGVLEFAPTLAALQLNGNLNDLAFAKAESYAGNPNAGYLFKVLTAQGTGAQGGAMEYLDERGNMTLGFGLVAIPAGWTCGAASHTFMVSHHGKIYVKLFESSAETQDSEITVFDPAGWVVAE